MSDGKDCDPQVLYMGRWVSKEHFKAFVYSANEVKLAKSYQEFSELVSSGLWSVEPVQAKTEPDCITVDIKPKRVKKCRNLPKV